MIKIQENNKSPEILVVDDVPGAASDYAELIQLAYKFNVESATNAEEAIKVIKNHHIKVVVLDQMMPDMLGTELYQIIKDLSPGTKAIMLTGEAPSKHVGAGLNLKFDYYLPKDEIEKLPHVVFELFTKYHIQLQKKTQLNEEKLLHSDKLCRFLPIPITYYSLVAIHKTKERHIFEDDWETKSTINAGEKTEIEYEMTYQNKTVLTCEIESKLKGELGISENNLSKLKTSLTSELKNHSKQSIEQSNTCRNTIKRTYSLPLHHEDLEKEYVVKRDIEAAPIYKEFRVIIKKECRLCNSSQLYPITIYQQTRKYATRQVDHTSKGKTKPIDSGSIKL